jgi:hypothetical protein
MSGSTPLLLNDIILTIYSPAIRFDREIYEELCRRLYDFYDTQTRSNHGYRFSSQTGASCHIDSRHIRLTEFFGESSREHIVASLVDVARHIIDIFGGTCREGYDLQLSARLPQRELNDGHRVNFLSSEEFIASRFLGDIDYSPLSGRCTGVGLRFLFDRNGANHDLRIEPFFKDRRYLFLDLGIQFTEQPKLDADLSTLLHHEIDFFQTSVVDFVRFKNDSQSTSFSHDC